MNNSDVYDLWLSYKDLKSRCSGTVNPLERVTLIGQNATAEIIAKEIGRTGLSRVTEIIPDAAHVQDAPSLLLMKEEHRSEIEKRYGVGKGFSPFDHGREGYTIDSRNYPFTLIEAATDRGLLYGLFELLRLLGTDRFKMGLVINDKPSVPFRMLNHWDNFDGSIERGYAGQSLWKWEELPEKIDSRYEDYARACASIGLNGTVLNNVNDAQNVLRREYLEKVAVLADLFRPYGIRTYISVNFASPMIVGGLDTADPLNEEVRQWWKDKAREIYGLIPHFGGFLVKADSEGQPGPFSYGRTHSEGANMLAEALEPHGGMLIWRAFVYGHGEKDRAATAYNTFSVMDGEFGKNVALQVKNGPIDFQPREPVQPLFGAMPKSNLFMEFQIAQEYLGQGNHIVYLAPMWKEILDFDTERDGEETTIAQMMVSENREIGGIAAVANSGDNRNWCSSPLHPMNWYAYGRLAWNPRMESEAIAREWINQTFGKDDRVEEILFSILMGSWEACVDYMTPLGLHHIMKEGHHYGPDPAFDGGLREDWRSTYYHRADETGLGFDRTESGSGAVMQYRESVAGRFGSLDRCPEKYLLWFHHVPWERKLSSGRTLKDELAYQYNRGVEKAGAFVEQWKSLEGRIDALRYDAVLEKLEIQQKDAREWRDVCLEYFLAFAPR